MGELRLPAINMYPKTDNLLCGEDATRGPTIGKLTRLCQPFHGRYYTNEIKCVS